MMPEVFLCPYKRLFVQSSMIIFADGINWKQEPFCLNSPSLQATSYLKSPDEINDIDNTGEGAASYFFFVQFVHSNNTMNNSSSFSDFLIILFVFIHYTSLIAKTYGEQRQASSK